jgi:cytochrome c553
MTAFQDGDRENDEYGRMRFIASQLTEEEIEQLAGYYSMSPSEE